MGINTITAKAVIFDVDGTLVDTLGRFHSAFNLLLEKQGGDPLEWKDFRERYIADTLDDVIAPPGTDGREERLHGFWLEFLRKYRTIDVAGDALIPGVREIIKKISEAGVPIAITTSCIVPADKLREELSGYEISKFADAIVTGADVAGDLDRGHHFSKVEILGLAAEKLGVEPTDCVVVGDYWNDVRDGKKLGAKTVAVLTGLMRRDLLASFGPNAIIEGVRDLPKVVRFEAG
jgi:phosphoglycolate phosphatase